MALKILILDYGMGNLHSIVKKINHLNSSSIISSNQDDLLKADKIILPGVGHFGKAMEKLIALNLIESLNEAVMVKKIPILGICLGMQLMAQKSEEGYIKGLNWMNGEVVKFIQQDLLKYKVPHVGWNHAIKRKESPLFKDIPDQSEFYFVHSYHYKTEQIEDVLTETDYGYQFPSSIEKNNIFGVQFHPEKSHTVGEQLLKNFIHL